jgi:hypothetical protein
MKTNPFTNDSDRRSIWDMLVDRDIKAFIAADWNMVANDFIEENFMGINGGRQGNPDGWTMGFPDLESYQNEWLQQAREFSAVEWGEDIEAALFRITHLRDIEIVGDSALIHKKFIGSIINANGDLVPTEWQTLYRCRKVKGIWKIAGFLGYIPHYLSQVATSSQDKIKLPQAAVLRFCAGQQLEVVLFCPERK